MNSIYDGRLLVVDDNEELCRMLTDMLHREGFRQVYTAVSYTHLILRRTWFPPVRQEQTSEILKLGKKCVDFSAGTVTDGNESCALTAKELAILKKLYENRGNIVTFDILCNTVWGDEYYGYENTLMVHIRRLREKIEENPSKPEWLLTVRGLGYRLAKEHSSKERAL